jgi:hypothetical protein
MALLLHPASALIKTKAKDGTEQLALALIAAMKDKKQESGPDLFFWEFQCKHRLLGVAKECFLA